MKKKRMAAFFCLVCLTVLWLVLPAGAAAVKISTEIHAEEIEKLRVEFCLVDCQEMFGTQGTLFYEEEYLEFEEAVGLQEDWNFAAEKIPGEKGEISFTAYSQTMEEPLSGYIPVFIATFSVKEGASYETEAVFRSEEVIVTDGETEAEAVDAEITALVGKPAEFHETQKAPPADKQEEGSLFWAIFFPCLAALLTVFFVFLLILRKREKRRYHRVRPASKGK